MNYLIFGASSGIAQAIISQLLSQSDTQTITEQWRTPPPLIEEAEQIVRQRYLADPSNEKDDLSPFFDPLPDVVINCIGMLHEEKTAENQWVKIQPEKCIEQISDHAMHRLFQVNTLTNVHIAHAITQHLPRKHPLKFIALSALVGSISQNHLGGWYSYRMSKAALNMFLQTLSIEWKRRNPNASCVAVHPGTTETQLSREFLQNHPANKLYNATTTALRILTIANNLTVEQSGKLLMWDGTEIPF